MRIFHRSITVLIAASLLAGLVIVRPAMAHGVASYAAAIEAAEPAVVNITTSKVITANQHPYLSDPVLRRFFGDVLRQSGRQVETSLGSGVIVDPRGYVLTNNHVIADADEIQISLQDGRTAAAKLVGNDPEADLAVLTVELDGLPAIAIGDSSKIRVGDVVLAIGNGFGVGQAASLGIISATGRSQLGISTFENFIQTDAAINPGNSGGALVDAEGKLIGINTAIFSKSGGSQGIGFAIPSNMAVDSMQQILEYGYPQRGWLGFEGREIDQQLAESLSLGSSGGLLITAILRDSPAHRAGLLPGDIIIGVNNLDIQTANQALLGISSVKPGNPVNLVIIRNGRQRTIRATAISRPNNHAERFQ